MALIKDRNNNPISMPNLSIARGDYPGVSHVNKFGRNPASATNATEEIWDGSYAHPWPTTATITDIRAATDSAITRGVVVLVEGLNAAWEPVSQTVTTDVTNSTTEMPLGTALIRINRAEVQDDTTMDQDLWFGDSAMSGATDIEAAIVAGNNQTEQAIYTVPLGYTAYITDYYADEHPVSGNAATSIDIKLWFRDNANGYAPKLKHTIGLAPGDDVQQEFHPFVVAPAQTDIYLTTTTVGGAADISAGFYLILVDESVQ